jgi:hypothetical protein
MPWLTQGRVLEDYPVPARTLTAIAEARAADNRAVDREFGTKGFVDRVAAARPVFHTVEAWHSDAVR